MYDPTIRLANLTSDINNVLAFEGTTVSDRYRSVIAAIEQLTVEPGERDAALHEAIAAGRAEEIPALVDQAAISRIDRLTIVNDAKGAAYAPLRAAYAETAASNHKKLSALFNNTAKKLRAAVAAVDTNAPGEQVVKLDDKARQAWSDAPFLAADLDQYLSGLAVAAELAGLSSADPSHTAKKDAHLGLVIQPETDVHTLRAIWNAWDNHQHRAGKWAAIIEAGATLEAQPTPTGIRRPAPIETRLEQIERGVYKQVPFDPENPPAAKVDPVTANRQAHAKRLLSLETA